jgi:hypothetical protein
LEAADASTLSPRATARSTTSASTVVFPVPGGPCTSATSLAASERLRASFCSGLSASEAWRSGWGSSSGGLWAGEQRSPPVERLALGLRQPPQPGALPLVGHVVGQQLEADGAAAVHPVGRRAVERDGHPRPGEAGDHGADLLVVLGAAPARHTDDGARPDERRGHLRPLPGGSQLDHTRPARGARVLGPQVQQRVALLLAGLQRQGRALQVEAGALLAALQLQEPLQPGDVLGDLGHGRATS